MGKFLFFCNFIEIFGLHVTELVGQFLYKPNLGVTNSPKHLVYFPRNKLRLTELR